MKICHRDLSPENMIILDNNALVIDFGMCLRVPYTPSGRHLINPQTPCGKLVRYTFCVYDYRHVMLLNSFSCTTYKYTQHSPICPQSYLENMRLMAMLLISGQVCSNI